MRNLTESEKRKRKSSELYFNNGTPKRKYMMCRDHSYIREVVRVKGRYDSNWCCAGLSYPFYYMGCDDKGREWEK